MNEVTIFKHTEFGEIRTLEINGEPWFVGKDIAEKLGYKDTSDALKRRVDDEDKGVGETPTPGGKQKIIIINESGLYSLILSSKLPKAKEFKHWVTSEVLPAIRRAGAYGKTYSKEEIDSIISEEVMKLLVNLDTRLGLGGLRNAAEKGQVENRAAFTRRQRTGGGDHQKQQL